MCCACNLQAQNLVLNGSFELNTAIYCIHDLPKKSYENTVQHSMCFGDNSTLSLINDSCLTCSPPVYWGGGAKEGNWFLIMLGREETFSTGDIYRKQGKISLKLDAPLLNTKRYKLSFWIKDPPPEPPNCIYAKNNYVNVGISNTDTTFGRHLVTTAYGDSVWQEYTYVFETQNAEEHITVTVGVNDTIDYGVFIDNFVLRETTEPLSTDVNEVPYHQKQLIKVVVIVLYL